MFATRFWSSNYEEGLDTLFEKLNQGILENQELLAVAKARADAESAHGAKLASIASSLTPKRNGFGRDDGATMRKAFEGILQQLSDEAKQHNHISSCIRDMVIEPFSKWSVSHQQRISASQADLQRLVKVYVTELNAMNKAQHRYFNRCRLDEENGITNNPAPDSPALTATRSSENFYPRTRHTRSVSAISTASSITSITPSAPTSEELVIGGHHYSAQESQELCKRMLDEIPQKSTHVKILGTYNHTVTGAQITRWLMENTAAESLSLAEEAGQMLVSRGLLRLVGQMGSRFVNSSVFTYQWKARAWEFAGLTTTTTSFTDMAERWARNTVSGGDGSSSGDDGKLTVRELDQKYRKSVDALEHARLELEAAMVEHFDYLERCERERLAAFKAVLLDFSAAISNIVPALSAGVDKLLLFHETADVDRDLRFLVENYQTGKYAPRVFVYDNYYSSADGAAVFGLDLELRARADKKRVPLVVAQILSSLDSKYPKMKDDEQRLELWKRPLHADIRIAQAARLKLNTLSLSNSNSVKAQEVFESLTPLALVQALKLYFLELPISVVGGQLYEILKSIYSRYSEDSSARLQALQNTLGQLTITHIATLDALTSHIHRLITIAKATDDDVSAIANEWGSALCRPKSESMLAINDVFPAQILRDLLSDRDRLFGELKRQQSSRSVSQRKLRQSSSPDVSKLVLNSERRSSRDHFNLPLSQPQRALNLDSRRSTPEAGSESSPLSQGFEQPSGSRVSSGLRSPIGLDEFHPASSGGGDSGSDVPEPQPVILESRRVSLSDTKVSNLAGDDDNNDEMFADAQQLSPVKSATHPPSFPQGE